MSFPGVDDPVEGPFAGLPGADHTAINEFIPRNMTVKAGEPITWKMMGSDHTISFNVPKYFPIMEFLDDGKGAPPSALVGRDPSELEPGGLGIRMMKTCMDGFHYETRPGSGARLVLRKLRPEGSGDAGSCGCGDSP